MSKDWEHDTIITVGVAEVDVDIVNDGTDTATQIYLNLGEPASLIEISFDVTGSIKKINGATLKKPIPVATDQSRIFKPRMTTEKGKKWHSFTITTSAAANVEVTVA